MQVFEKANVHTLKTQHGVHSPYHLTPRLCLLAAVACGLFATQASADALGYVTATTELDDGKPASSLWNAVDGKDTTAWCAKNADGKPRLTFGFERSVTITHIALVVGAKNAGALDPQRRRAHMVQVGDLQQRVEVEFQDNGELQVIALQPALKGKRIVVDFDDATGDANSPLCVAEVELREHQQVLTGAVVANQLRGLNSPEKRLLREWLDNSGAPERTLTFDLDGTFTYKYEPLLEGKPVKVRGKWRAVERAIVFDVGDKQMRVETKVTKVDEENRSTVELVISGEPPHPSMASAYRPAPMVID